MADTTRDGSPRQFLLLFYWEAGYPELPEAERSRRIDEFNRWAAAIETRGELVVSEKVLPEEPPVWLGGEAGDALAPEECPALPADIGRFCVVRVRDRDHAMTLARRSPHLRYGGLIAVQAIEPT
jgi:hypothetical protein